MNKKILLILGLTIFILIIFLVVVSLLFKKESKIPNDWEKYRNEEYGFELTYHKDWQVAYDEDMIFFLEKFPEGFVEKVGLSEIFYFSPEVFIMAILLEDDHIEETAEDLSYDYDVLSKEKISISNAWGYRFHISEKEYEIPEAFVYLIPQNNETLIIFLFDMDSAEKIISGFKLLSKNNFYPDKSPEELIIELTPGEEKIISDCEKSGGNWLYDYKECETDDSMADIKGFCDKYSGDYKECLSACRHHPAYPAIECISVCVQACSL